MQRKHNHELVPFAKKLRKNMTKEERHLWYDFLRSYPVRFLRQKVLGNYIVDFYCAKAKVVIELDGSQHYDPENRLADEERDRYLNELGITVLRYTNFDIQKRFEGVASDILMHIGLRFEDLDFDRDVLLEE